MTGLFKVRTVRFYTCNWLNLPSVHVGVKSPLSCTHLIDKQLFFIPTFVFHQRAFALQFHGHHMHIGPDREGLRLIPPSCMNQNRLVMGIDKAEIPALPRAPLFLATCQPISLSCFWHPADIFSIASLINQLNETVIQVQRRYCAHSAMPTQARDLG